MTTPVPLGGDCVLHAEARRTRYGFVPPGPCQDCMFGDQALFGESSEYVPGMIDRPELYEERRPPRWQRVRPYPWLR